MDAAQIADLLTQGIRGPSGAEDAGFHTGTILSWDSTTGLNSVLVNNTALTNLKAVQAGIPARYSVGDTVMIVRKQTQYFILGKVAAPGGGAGSAPVGNTIGTPVNQASTGGSFVDLTGSPGPSVSTYIGSNRAALILWNFKYDGFQSTVEMGFEVSGANTMAPGAFGSTTVVAGFTSSVAPTYTTLSTPAGTYLMGNSVLLSAGLTTFTAKYKVTTGTPGSVQANISNRSLTVIPL